MTAYKPIFEADIKAEDLENTVVELEETNQVSFGLTDRIGDFIVIGNMLIAMDPTCVKIFDLKQDRQRGLIHAQDNTISAIAHDDNFLYLELQGHSLLDPKDIVAFSYKEYGPGEFDHPEIHHVGERFGRSGDSLEDSIERVIVSFPLGIITGWDTIVSDPVYVTEDPKILVPKMPSSVDHSLDSKAGHVRYRCSEYNYNVFGTIESEILLKDGKVFEATQDEMKALIEEEKSKRKIPQGLHLHYHGRPIESYFVLREGWDSTGEPERISERLSVIFKDGGTGPNLGEISHTKLVDDKFYVVMGRYEKRGSGHFKVASPEKLLTYQVRLRGLKPLP